MTIWMQLNGMKKKGSPKVFLALFLTICPVFLLLRLYFSCLHLCKRLSIVDERFKCARCRPSSGTLLEEETRDITSLCPVKEPCRPLPGEVLCVPAECCLPLAGMEWVDIQHRTFSGILTSIFWSIGNMLLAMVAYLVREWHWLLVAVTGPCLLSIVCLWWVQRPAAGWLEGLGVGCDLPPLLCKHAKRCNTDPRTGSGNPERSRTHLCPALGLPRRGSSWKLSGLGFISPHLRQDQEPRSHHSFGDKEEAGLGLRPGI